MNNHVALYRKYRPRTFDDVRGQSEIVSFLQQAIKTKKPSHAYLFFGSRGTGKTSLARIFAQQLDIAPEDTYEIDAASHTGVDHIRELIESVQTIPFRSSYKMYIIDEVHMLSKSAFNALLKTLEEPPAHVVFVLATTELHKVPDTVISRCQLCTFQKPTIDILSETVQHVASSEGFTIDANGATLIGLLGDGSYRDTLGFLERVCTSISGTTILRDDIERILGLPHTQHMLQWIDAVHHNDATRMLETIKELRNSHMSEERFLLLVLHYVRSILFIRFDKQLQEQVVSTETDSVSTTLHEYAKTHTAINSGFLKQLLHTYRNAKQSPLAYLATESLVFELSEIKK